MTTWQHWVACRVLTSRKIAVPGGCSRLVCDHTCYNICRHEDREGQLRFRPKLARRVIAALIAALIAGLISGPAVIQAALEPGGHVGSSHVSGPPAAARGLLLEEIVAVEEEHCGDLLFLIDPNEDTLIEAAPESGPRFLSDFGWINQ